MIMSKWIAEFDLEDGDTMPEHMDLNYMGSKIDFHCRPMWISVKDSIPMMGQDVLICDYDGDMYISCLYTDGRWGYDDYGNKLKNIIAWMPLPEPYKTESE